MLFRLFGGKEKAAAVDETKAAPDTWSALVDMGSATAAGVHVSATTALRAPAVLAAVRVRVETISQLPLHLYRRLDGGGKERATDHPLERLISGRPNPWSSAVEFIGRLEQDSILHGSGFAVATRSGGRVIELVRLDPQSVTVETDPGTLEPRYIVTKASGAARDVYSWMDVLHVPGSLDGVSPIRACSEAIGLAITLEKHASRIFGNGGRPSGVLQHPKVLGPDLVKRLKDAWNQQFVGDGAGRTVVLEEGMKFEPLTFKSVDLQFQELRHFQLGEIARAFGVPPVLLHDLSRATFSNFESASQAFLTYSILPRLKVWQGAIARLLSREEQQTHFADFTVDGLTKANISERFAAYSQAVASRIFNPNEIRAMENRAPYPGGDEYLNPAIDTAPGAAPARRNSNMEDEE